MLVIIHFFVSISGNVPISSSEIEKIKITFSNSDVLSSHHANFAYTAGALAASVPFLAYFITKGLSFVLNNAAQHFGGIAQSLSVGEAQSAATGNVSMASYSPHSAPTFMNKFPNIFHRGNQVLPSDAG